MTNVNLEEARELLRSGEARIADGEHEAAIEILSRLIERFFLSSESEVRACVDEGLLRRAFSFVQQARFPDALADSEIALRRLDESAPPATRLGSDAAVKEQVALALRMKAWLLGRLGRPDEAETAYEEIVSRFSAEEAPGVRAHVVDALSSRAFMLAEAGNSTEAVLLWDRALERSIGLGGRETKATIARSLLNRGLTLDELDKHEEAIRSYDLVVRDFEQAVEPEVRRDVAWALYNKAVTLRDLNRPNDALTCYQEVIDRFRNSTRTGVAGEGGCLHDGQGGCPARLGRVS